MTNLPSPPPPPKKKKKYIYIYICTPASGSPHFVTNPQVVDNQEFKFGDLSFRA